MEFEALLSRADAQTLRDILGREAVHLVSLMDERLTSPGSLRSLLRDLHSPEELLLDPQSLRPLLLLLRPEEAACLWRSLDTSGGDSGDVFTNLQRFSPRRGSSTEASLFGFFGLTPPPVERPVELPDAVTYQAEYALFPHQRNAVRDLQHYLRGSRPRVVLHMPTGSGKTRTAMNLISDHLRDNEPTVAIWLAHSEELCEQAAEEFRAAWMKLGNREVEMRRFWGGHSLEPDELEDAFVIAGLSKTYSAARSEIRFISELGRRCSLVVMDEAHQAIAETYRLILESLVVLGSDTGLLGLTATPGRTWSDIDADQELADFFFSQKVGLSVRGFENPIDYLMSEGYLAQVEFRELFHSGGLDLDGADLKRIQDSFEIPSSVLSALGQDEQRNLKILDEVQSLTSAHQRIILFATSVDHSELMATALQASGVAASSITSQTNQVTRRNAIDAFKSGDPEPQVLCNYGVLTAGFDAPATSCAVIARPTISLVLYSQMVGRAIRGPRAGGNRFAEIVTVVDRELPGFADIAAAFHNWEDVWEDEQ